MSIMPTDLKSGKASGITVTHATQLTSGEIASLWTTYMESRLVICVYRYFLNNVNDPAIQALINTDCNVLNQRAAWIGDTFRREEIPVPTGFADADVDTGAARLFTDPFYLYYIEHKTRIAIAMSSLALTTTARPDVRDFYYQCVHTTADVFQRTADLMLEKGLPIRTPYIAINKATDMVEKHSFLAGYFGAKRPLLAQEISSFALGVHINQFGKLYLTGLRQTVQNERVNEYLGRGIELSESLARRYSVVLTQDEVSVPAPPEVSLTDSTQQPFSDKLVMAQLQYMNSGGLVDKAFLGTTSLRSDLIALITGAIADISLYAKEGIDIMIDNGWLEEPPRLLDRAALAERTH